MLCLNVVEQKVKKNLGTNIIKFNQKTDLKIDYSYKKIIIKFYNKWKEELLRKYKKLIIVSSYIKF